MSKNYLVVPIILITAVLYSMQPLSPGDFGSPGEEHMRARHEASLRRQMHLQHRAQPRSLFKPDIDYRVELVIRGANAQPWEIDHVLKGATPAQIKLLNKFAEGIRGGFKTQLSEDEKVTFATLAQFVQDVLHPHMVPLEDEIDATLVDEDAS